MTRMEMIILSLLLLAGCAATADRPAGQDLSEASPSPSPASAGDANEAVMSDFDALDKEFEKQKVTVADPLEGLNRFMFQFNDTLYFCVLKPVAQAYCRVTAEPVRVGVRNFFHNLTTPVRFVSCLVQGKVEVAGMEFGRFVVNTTWGILGVADPAKERLDLDPNDDEDMGQALAVRGVGNGFYIVWPLLGPSTLRDSVGLVGDQFLNPLGYLRPWVAYTAVSAVRVTNETSLSLGQYESLKAAAIEPYSAIRDAYIQYRAKSIQR
jgi:phospholipid-binding lipoprotein MlaA